MSNTLPILQDLETFYYEKFFCDLKKKFVQKSWHKFKRIVCMHVIPLDRGYFLRLKQKLTFSHRQLGPKHRAVCPPLAMVILSPLPPPGASLLL